MYRQAWQYGLVVVLFLGLGAGVGAWGPDSAARVSVAPVVPITPVALDGEWLTRVVQAEGRSLAATMAVEKLRAEIGVMRQDMEKQEHQMDLVRQQLNTLELAAYAP